MQIGGIYCESLLDSQLDAPEHTQIEVLSIIDWREMETSQDAIYVT